MNSKKKNQIIVAIICFCVCIYKIYSSFIFVNMQTRDLYNEEIGIIDTYLSKSYDNVEYYALNTSNANNMLTHGDKMIDFLRNSGYNKKIYYFSAYDDEKITSETLCTGLEWLKEKGVTRINISLSSKRYSKDVETWISENKDNIQVYASYNNNLDTVADYPAMYSHVAGSGCDSRINYKQTDIQYRKNAIILFSGEFFHYYKGNSYLSLLSVIQQ